MNPETPRIKDRAGNGSDDSLGRKALERPATLMARTVALAAMVLVVATGVALAGPSRWIHVHVVEDGGADAGGETVKVNVPVSVLEAVLPAINIEMMKNGRIHLDNLDVPELDQIDFRTAWSAIRDSEDADYVVVEGDDENVRVSKAGRYMTVHVGGKSGKAKETVDVKVPLSVVDALFSDTKPGELNIVAAIRELARHDDEEFVVVDEGNTKVRIWIDGRKNVE